MKKSVCLYAIFIQLVDKMEPEWIKYVKVKSESIEMAFLSKWEYMNLFDSREDANLV